MDTYFGIDFGTTNSSLAVNIDGVAKVLDVDPFNKSPKSMKSVLFFNEYRETFVGQNAVNRYVEECAHGRFMQSIKTFLPSKSFDKTVIYGRNYHIEDLIAIILRNLKSAGEAYAGKEVADVVLGRPVVFSSDPARDVLAESRLKKAAVKAGFKNIHFQYEPVAAALAYEQTLSPSEEKLVLIGDFGGGTSDFTVIRVKGGASVRRDRLADVLSLGGVYIAGDKFDSQIMWDKVAQHFGRYAKYRPFGSDKLLDVPVWILRTLCQWHKIPLIRDSKTREIIGNVKKSVDNVEAIQNLENIIAENYGYLLFQSIERAKCELSDLDQTRIQFDEHDLHLSEHIGGDEFESMNLENFESIATCIDETIKKAGVSHGQIDTIFLTGGTSYIPWIQQMFVERFGNEKLKKMDAFTSVAQGLGVSAP